MKKLNIILYFYQLQTKNYRPGQAHDHAFYNNCSTADLNRVNSMKNMIILNDKFSLAKSLQWKVDLYASKWLKKKALSIGSFDPKSSIHCKYFKIIAYYKRFNLLQLYLYYWLQGYKSTLVHHFHQPVAPL